MITQPTEPDRRSADSNTEFKRFALFENRRSFVRLCFFWPLFGGLLTTNFLQAKEERHASHSDDEFVLVDGWVLRRSDLFDTQR